MASSQQATGRERRRSTAIPQKVVPPEKKNKYADGIGSRRAETAKLHRRVFVVNVWRLFPEKKKLCLRRCYRVGERQRRGDAVTLVDASNCRMYTKVAPHKQTLLRLLDSSDRTHKRTHAHANAHKFTNHLLINLGCIFQYSRKSCRVDGRPPSRFKYCKLFCRGRFGTVSCTSNCFNVTNKLK